MKSIFSIIMLLALFSFNPVHASPDTDVGISQVSEVGIDGVSIDQPIVFVNVFKTHVNTSFSNTYPKLSKEIENSEPTKNAKNYIKVRDVGWVKQFKIVNYQYTKRLHPLRC